MAITTDAFIITPTRVIARSDLVAMALWMDTRGVIILSLLTHDGCRDYVYADYATAQDDHDRIDDGSATVTLRGESSGAAYDRIAAVLKATGAIPESVPILRGRDD